MRPSVLKPHHNIEQAPCQVHLGPGEVIWAEIIDTARTTNGMTTASDPRARRGPFIRGYCQRCLPAEPSERCQGWRALTDDGSHGDCFAFSDVRVRCRPLGLDDRAADAGGWPRSRARDGAAARGAANADALAAACGPMTMRAACGAAAAEVLAASEGGWPHERAADVNAETSRVWQNGSPCESSDTGGQAPKREDEDSDTAGTAGLAWLPGRAPRRCRGGGRSRHTLCLGSVWFSTTRGTSIRCRTSFTPFSRSSLRAILRRS